MTTPENSDPPAEVGCGQTITHPLVLPEKFNGTGNFGEWISHFESIVALNKWNEEEKTLWIQVRLTEKVHMALMRFPGSTTQAYSSIKEALRERFEPSSKQELYKAEFKSRRKQKSESWCDFVDDLLRLVDRAFPTLQFEGKEQLALPHYLDQLEPMQVSFGVKQCRPKTVHKAVSIQFNTRVRVILAKPQSRSVSHIDSQKEPM